MMLKVLIVEDEIITATDLQETLEKYDYKVVGIAKNYSEAIEILNFRLPDIILIDVQLRNSSADGIELASYVNKNYKIPFVFLTANSESETFQKAKQLKPAAYLLKPYKHRELAFQIELAYHHYKLNTNTSKKATEAESLYLPYNKGYQRVNKNDVILIKAGGAYVEVFVSNRKKPYVFSMNLGYIGQFFDDSNFFQVSRSFLVNLDYMERFDSDYIYFKGIDEKVSIPSSRKNEFLRKVDVIKTPRI